jgi:hypothetical protein
MTLIMGVVAKLGFSSCNGKKIFKDLKICNELFLSR